MSDAIHLCRDIDNEAYLRDWYEANDLTHSDGTNLPNSGWKLLLM